MAIGETEQLDRAKILFYNDVMMFRFADPIIFMTACMQLYTCVVTQQS